MKKALKFIALVALLAGTFGLSASQAKAYYPYLTAYSNSYGNLQVTVNSAAPYSRVDLSYRPSGTSLWTTVTNIGSTDYNGYLSQNVNIGSNSNQSMEAYVMVAGQQSSTVTVNSTNMPCPAYNCNSGSLSFSPSSLNLSVGQSQSVSIYNNYLYNPNSGVYYNNYYVSNNTNPSAVSASVSGSSLNVNANYSGSASITVCQYNSGNSCGTLYVTVSGNGCNYGSCVNQITFSPSNPNLNLGQTLNVSVYSSGGYSLYISSNSNPSVADAYMVSSGTSIGLSAKQIGSTTITVCNSGYAGGCGSLYVTVANNNNYQLTFSQNNINLNYGQSGSVTVYGGNGSSYYVSSNSNSNVITTNVSGNTVYLYANNTGSANLYICSSGYSNQCGYVYVTVGGGSGSGLSLSPTSLTLNNGQNSIVTIYGYNSSGYYISGNSNSGVATATVSGNTVAVTGYSQGSTTITVCSSGYLYSNQCAYLYVTVNYGYGNQVSLSQSNVSLYVGKNTTLSINGNNYNGYYVSSNSNSGVVSASVSGSSLNLYAASQGSSSVTVCANNGSYGCATVYVTVNGGGVLGSSTYANGTLVSSNGTIYITYKNTKTGFANYSAFTGLGFKIANVMLADTSTLSDSGFVVNTSKAQHPWGSWVKWGSTVYFVHESGLVPISSYDIFLNNGGNPNLIVPANTYDTRLPILPLMVNNDSRLQ